MYELKYLYVFLTHEMNTQMGSHVCPMFHMKKAFTKVWQTSWFNLYHAKIGDLNPCTTGLPARF
jgi:hypothetical protein